MFNAETLQEALTGSGQTVFCPYLCPYRLNISGSKHGWTAELVITVPLPRRFCFPCSLFASLFAFLSEFKQDCAKHTGLISMKLGERLSHEARKNQLNFGVDLVEISLAFFFFFF